MRNVEAVQIALRRPACPSDFADRTGLTVRLMPGSDNVNRVTGGYGDVSPENITASPFME